MSPHVVDTMPFLWTLLLLASCSADQQEPPSWLLDPQMQEIVQASFLDSDKDGDGKLTAQEAMTNEPDKDSPAKIKFFQKDEDGDGKLNMAEYLKFLLDMDVDAVKGEL
eukprot:TRINITY_DN56670_c0_g1_i1.p1 TRINITY_DN56670_c0_g1~~TRINITY_DN56670_c0_g1_i1.p1  ORF type:complete len:109 (+),score=38.85 TRINITY_DN56670_c0_g1_i1:10-336(+)